MTEEIPHINWAGIPLQQKFDQIHRGPGGEIAASAARSLGALAPEFSVTADRVQAVLRSVGVEWEGQAGTRFTDAMNTAGQWAHSSSDTTQSASSHVQAYAAAYDAARPKIPNPQELAALGSQSFGGAVADGAGKVLQWEYGTAFGVGSDYSKRLAAHANAESTANRVMTEHEDATRRAIDAFPALSPAPPIAIDTPSTPSPVTTHQPGARAAAAPSPPRAPQPGVAGIGVDTADSDAPSSTTPSSSTPNIPTPTHARMTPAAVIPAPAGTVPEAGGNHGVVPMPSTPLSPLPPSPRRPTGPGRTSGGPAGPGESSPLAARGEARLSERIVGRGYPGDYGAASAPRSISPTGGMPLGGMGGAGRRGEDQTHRNNVFLASDELFTADVDDLVSPPVFGASHPDDPYDARDYLR